MASEGMSEKGMPGLPGMIFAASECAMRDLV